MGMKDPVNGKKNPGKKSNDHLDMFEMLEDIMPLCDAGKAFIRGEMIPPGPAVTNDISRFSARRIRKTGRAEPE